MEVDAMDVSITVSSSSEAVADVKTVELSDTLRNIDGVNIAPPAQADTSKRARIGGLEILATILGSAAAYQLAAAVRDFVTRQDVEVSLTKSNGDKLTITAKRGDPQAVADIVGFLMKQHEKQSLSVEKDESNKSPVPRNPTNAEEQDSDTEV
jgi:outer membrane lipoprotein SlyB